MLNKAIFCKYFVNICNHLNSFLAFLSIALLTFVSCEKEEEPKIIKRIEIYSSRNYVYVDDKMVKTPALFYWEVGAEYKINTVGSWSNDNVNVVIYKDLNLDLDISRLGSLEFMYEVKP